MSQSPCINICRMDPQHELCVGCLRTLDEIANWSRLDDTVRQRILLVVAERRRQKEASQEAAA